MVTLSNLLKAATGSRIGRIEKRWSFDAKTSITTKPVIGKLENLNVIVFGTKDGKLFLLNEKSEIIWTYSIEEKLGDVEIFFKEVGKASSIYCTPVIADTNNDGKNEILFGSETGKFYSLDPKGKLLWSFKAKDAIRSSPLIEDINNDGKKEIIFGSRDRNLYALDNNGKLLWQSSCEAGIESPAALMKDENVQIIFGSNDGTVYSLNKEGHLLWKFKTEGKTNEPVIGNIYGDNEKYIIIGSYDTLYVLDKDGKPRWRYKTGGRITSAVCLADLDNDGKQEIIFGSCDDKVYVLSCEGSRIWSYETDFWIVASPLTVDIDNDSKAEVVIGSYDNSLYILDGQGEFALGYMPGISSVTQQSGSYADIMTSQPGNYTGKKLWQFKTEGMIIGVSKLLTEKKEKNLIVAIDNGRIEAFVHKKR